MCLIFRPCRPMMVPIWLWEIRSRTAGKSQQARSPVKERGENALTMSPIVGNDTTHAHLGRTFQQALGDNRISPRSALQSSGDRQDSVVNARNHLAHASLDAGFIAQVGDVLARLANDHARLLGGDNGAQGQH